MSRLLRLLAVTAILSHALPAGPIAAQIDPARLAGLKVRSIGPSGMSGRISAIDAVERDPNIIYVGSATGGLWKSTSGGVTWEPLTDSIPAYSIGAVAIFQAAPDIVWIGTGERNRRNTAGVGTGVYKSMNGGKTWQHLGLDSTGAIDAIVLHPTDPNIAYVGALGNTWAESPHRGVYRTTDGGKTWQKILYVNQTTGAGDLVMDPSNPNHLLAAMWDHRRWPWFFRSGGPGSGLYVTYDGGETWRKLGPKDGLPAGELGRIGLDFSRSNPKVVYAIVEATRSALLRSEDGGDTWKTVNQERGIAQRPFYYAQVRVDPTNENRVYNVHGTIDLSEDGGKTFRVLLPFERVHVDHHALWISPDGRILYDGNDGGVYISRDRGTSWRFVENLPLAQFYHIAVDWETPYNVMGGLQDNGSWRGPSQVWHNGGIRFYDWKEVGFGDGFATIPDPKNPRYLYTTSQGGNIIRSDLLTGERKAIRPAHPQGIELRFNWNPAMAIDPHDGALYFGSQFVHRSTDMGATWTAISPDLTTNDPEKQKQLESGGLTRDVTSAENHTTILVIAPSPVERGVIWAGTDDGNVQLTRDGGATWTNLSPRIRGVPPNTWVPHIEASPHDAATAFVIFDDHRRGNNRPYVFKTTDYGNTWTSLVTPEIESFNFAHVIEQDPVEPNLLFLGTEHGMYLSFNGGRNWQLWRQGLPRVPVLALVVHPREHDLVIGTHGRAAYILDDIRPLRALARDPSIAQRPLHLFEIPETIEYQVAQVDGMRFTADAMFRGENRPYGALITYSVGGDSPPDTVVTVEVLDESGAVIRKFPGPAKPGLNRVPWDLRRDAFRRPRGERQEQPEAFRPAGPLVLPGTYTVRVKLKDHEASATVAVRDDPRFDIPLAAQQEKFDAIMRVGQRQEVAAEAVDRLREAKRSADRAVEQLSSDSAVGEDLRNRVRAAADSLEKSLTQVEELFTGPQDVQGIVRAPDAVLPQLEEVYGALTSSRDAPTEAQMLDLRKAEADLSQALERVNALFAGPVAEFRRLLQEANVQWFPSREPLSLDWRPSRRR